MKTLGLLGGMSWESTLTYYQTINRLTRERLGGLHSAPLIIWSGDFAPIAELQAAGQWRQAGDVLVAAARQLQAAGAEALLICANTMHKVAPQITAATNLPLLHIADATAEAIKTARLSRPLLLATKFTMEQDFYRNHMAAAGVECLIPQQEARERLHAIIFDELVQGKLNPRSRDYIIELTARAMQEEGVDAVILGCTEFGLLLDQSAFDIPLFDTARLHAQAAVDFALT